MITLELLNYIRSERQKGTDESIIRSNLLSNGWTNEDVNQGLNAGAQSGNVGVPTPPVVDPIALKKKKNQIFWSSFITLIFFDAVLIFMYKMFAGQFGLFGIGPVSILVRLLIILSISYFVANSSTNPGSTSPLYIVLKIFGAIVIGILVTLGLLFASCLAVFTLGSNF